MNSQDGVKSVCVMPIRNSGHRWYTFLEIILLIRNWKEAGKSHILLATQKLTIVAAWPGLEREEKEAGEWTRVLRIQERKRG